VPLSRGAVAAILTLVLLVAGCGGEEENAPVEPDPAFGRQPNVVFILTDDQDLASFNRRTMPHTFRLLVDRGTTFANHVDTTPLCCPSRAALQSGQYGHNNGVLNNKPGYGDLEEKDNLLPVWLQRAGYTTAYVGKFMNGYDSYVEDKDDVAPGWDRWSVLSGNALGYYDFRLTVDGKQRKEEYSGDEYMTDVLNDRAVELIGDLAGPDPFYLQVGELAPHVENLNADSGGPCGGDAVPARRDEGRFAGARLPDMPAIREADVSDKPAIVSGLPPLDERKLEQIRGRYECRLETLPALDRGIRRIVATLRRTGELDDTVIAFASDNGNFHGQHRLPGGKGLAYRQAAQVPFVLRVPPRYLGDRAPVPRVEAPTANIDYVPTLVEWSGTETCPVAGQCRVMDGRSLLPLLTGRQGEWPRQRPILTELDIGKEQLQSGRGISCRYEGVRQGPWVYIRHTSLPDLATGICEETETIELYNHAIDPYELDNLAVVAAGSRAAAAEDRLSRLTDELVECAGIEGRDPEPANGPYCR
jgi:N-acetylglucosamine-6-sulfatase